jgi:ubiquinone/menaquinone biosynthesis C-methylase UbiE
MAVTRRSEESKMSKQGRLAPLYRAFWSVYGRYAWDEQRAPARPSAPPERIVALLQGRRGSGEDWVLDAGCGTGNYAVALARAGWRVVGIDFAPGMLARAQEKVTAELAGLVSFEQADLNAPLALANVPFALDGRFDHAISISVLQAVADPLFALGEMRRVLKPGGTLVMSLPTRDSQMFAHSIGENIRYRIRHLARRTPGRVLLVLLKALGDRYSHTTRWSAAEAEEMVRSAGFAPLRLGNEWQILVMAERQ